MKSPLTSADQAEIPEPGIRLFPNPASDRLTISTAEIIREITIFDIHGKQVKRITAINSQTSDISVRDLAAGEYFVRTQNEMGRKSTVRFVKN